MHLILRFLCLSGMACEAEGCAGKSTGLKERGLGKTLLGSGGKDNGIWTYAENKIESK